MPANYRMQCMQEDLQRTAAQLEEVCHGLAGHVRYLHHTMHGSDAKAMDGHAQSLLTSALELREVAKSITP